MGTEGRQNGPVHVVFVEPSFPDNQKQFVRGLHAVGATVVGVGERPKDWLDDDVKQWLTHYEQVPSVTDEGRLAEAVQWVQHRAPVERLEATVEAHVMPAARARPSASRGHRCTRRSSAATSRP